MSTPESAGESETGSSRRPIPFEEPLFNRVDGEAFFIELVDRFYALTMADPVLAPLYPSDDIEGAKERLRLFLIQFWGGPQTYSETRGHPRLRMRHVPYVIGDAEQAAWLTNMTTAVNEMAQSGKVSPEDAASMIGYFDHSSKFMRNAES